MTTLTRRTRRPEPDDAEQDERPRRRRGYNPANDTSAMAGGDNGQDDPPRRSRRSRRDADERPTRSRRSRDPEPDDEPDERPSRRRGGRRDEKPSARGRSGTGGFGTYSQKRRTNSNFADEFKPADNTKVLGKFLDEEPFDVYLQHWIEDGDASGKTRHSFVCYDDPDYFDDAEAKGCPLCGIGDPASTYALWRILDLSDPRKPKVVIWKTSVTVTDKLERIANAKRTSPLNREDLYFEFERVVKGKKTTWEVQPVKEDEVADEPDYGEDFLLDPEEIEDFAKDAEKFTDRTCITQVDSWSALDDLAASLE